MEAWLVEIEKMQQEIEAAATSDGLNENILSSLKAAGISLEFVFNLISFKYQK